MMEHSYALFPGSVFDFRSDGADTLTVYHWSQDSALAERYAAESAMPCQLVEVVESTTVRRGCLFVTNTPLEEP